MPGGEPKPDVQPATVTVKSLNKGSSNASGSAGGGGWDNADALFFGGASSSQAKGGKVSDKMLNSLGTSKEGESWKEA